jgi:hypothetical protein
MKDDLNGTQPQLFISFFFVSRREKYYTYIELPPTSTSIILTQYRAKNISAGALIHLLCWKTLTTIYFRIRNETMPHLIDVRAPLSVLGDQNHMKNRARRQYSIRPILHME